jgi:hypothetical protein
VIFASETLITPAADMTNWQNIIVALITASSLVAVAYLQFVFKAGKKRGEEAKAEWAQNKADHATVVSMIQQLGKSLGRSIDKTNDSVDRIESKLDTHIRDHALGGFDIDDVRFKTGEKVRDGK